MNIYFISLLLCCVNLFHIFTHFIRGFPPPSGVVIKSIFFIDVSYFFINTNKRKEKKRKGRSVSHWPKLID